LYVRRLAALAALFGLSAWVPARADQAPCQLSDRDRAALEHPALAPDPDHPVAPANIDRLPADELAALCATRRFFDDLDAKSVDDVTDAHDPGELPKGFRRYVTAEEAEKYKDLFYLFLEKKVGRDQTLWKTFSYPELGLSVSAPGVIPPQPWHRADACEVAQGYLFNVIRIFLFVGAEDIGCLGAQPGLKLLDEIIQALAFAGKVDPNSIRPVSVSGVPGYAFLVEAPHGWYVRGRYFVVGKKLLFSLDADTGEGRKPSEVASRFEDSLRVLDSVGH